MAKRGFALILSFIVIVVLIILGAALLSRSISEGRLAQHYQDSVRAFWLAEAGINDALNQLRLGTSSGSSSIINSNFGEGGYRVDFSGTSNNLFLTAHGFVPYGSARVERIIQATITKTNSVPPNFYSNAIYTSGNVTISGSAYSVEGNVEYAGSIIGSTGNISGTITHDPTIAPLAHLDFAQLRAISQEQGNYHSTSSGTFPESFWYNEEERIPNVVFVEGQLDLTGKTRVGGFFVVGGEVVYDATLSGNVAVDGAIYTLGGFTINGGGNVLNVDGGIWAGNGATLNGHAKLAYNESYMSAIQDLDINPTFQISSWRDTQNPYY